jgi:uncharacterized protein YndB with AHSA1/START domain
MAEFPMCRQDVRVERNIHAPAELVYKILADYRNDHPHILPKSYFSGYKVERGGIGGGTEIRFQMQVFGRIQNFHMTVMEPEPGRLLVETDFDSGSITTFTISPIDGKGIAKVAISTKLPVREGVFGLLERLFTNLFLRHIYAQELKLLEAFAKARYARGC